MKIEISTGRDFTWDIPDVDPQSGEIWYIPCSETEYEHHGYYNSIDEAIEALQILRAKEREIENGW